MSQLGYTDKLSRSHMATKLVKGKPLWWQQSSADASCPLPAPCGSSCSPKKTLHPQTHAAKLNFPTQLSPQTAMPCPTLMSPN